MDSWGDCYRVVGWLGTQLPTCYMNLSPEDDDIRLYWRTPFDPHDIKYWMFIPRFAKEYFRVTHATPPDGVRIEICRGEDFRYTKDGGGAVAKVKLHFFQTRYNYGCPEWEANGRDTNPTKSSRDRTRSVR